MQLPATFELLPAEYDAVMSNYHLIQTLKN